MQESSIIAATWRLSLEVRNIPFPLMGACILSLIARNRRHANLYRCMLEAAERFFFSPSAFQPCSRRAPVKYPTELWSCHEPPQQEKRCKESSFCPAPQGKSRVSSVEPGRCASYRAGRTGRNQNRSIGRCGRSHRGAFVIERLRFVQR